MISAALDVGQLVRVRGQQWVVSDLSTATLPTDELAAATLPGRTLVTLTSVSEDDLSEELSVVWEVEPGRAVIPSGALPDVPEPEAWDAPQTLGALVDAVRLLHDEANGSNRIPFGGGQLVVRNSRLDQLFDPHTGDRLDLRVPPKYEGSRLFFVQWLNNDQFTLIAENGRPGGLPTGDLLTCRIAAGRCEVTIEASSWSTPPLLPGNGYVGAELALLHASRGTPN